MLQIRTESVLSSVKIVETWQELKAVRQDFRCGVRVIDLETTGLNPRQEKVITIAIGDQEGVVVIDTRSYYGSTEKEQAYWREALQGLLERKTLVWVGHNLGFDWGMLAVHFGVRLPVVYDTMLVEQLLWSDGDQARRYSLLETAKRYGLVVGKEARNWFIGLDKRQGEWGASLPVEQVSYIEQDILIPSKIYEQQQARVREERLSSVVELESGALPMIAAMEVQGMYIDRKKWEGIVERKIREYVRMTESLRQELGKGEMCQGSLLEGVVSSSLNLQSSHQLKKALEGLGIVVESTGKEALEEVREKHEIIEKILEWKKLAKFVSSFGEKLLVHVEEDNRIHAHFQQLGAVTGRMSCKAPNLQQIPKPTEDEDNLRACFVAPKGSKLLVADLSNIELRILAEVSQDAKMLQFFAEGKDLHSETAKLMFHLGEEVDPKKHLINGVKARDIAKSINFGLAYGMGPQGLAGRVGVSVEVAEQLMSSYFATYRGVASYLQQAAKKGIMEGKAVSLSGRRRSFPKEMGKGEKERRAKNYGIQGTNADILKRALGLLFERLPEKTHLVLTVHDELVLEAPESLVDVAEKMLAECMYQACREFLPTVALPEQDVLIADCWVKG